MKAIGIIAEYNPFHEGHKYQIETIRRETHADYVVVVMSGDFVQRGMPALLPKHQRSGTALLNGADLILELPVGNSTASAEYFACGGISLLDQLGIIDSLCFGAETNNLPLLKKIADILIEEPARYNTALKSALQKGLSFPAARSEALLCYFSSDIAADSHPATAECSGKDVKCCSEAYGPCTISLSEVEQVLASPNNILAIEYLKALRQFDSSMKPYLIQRKGNAYHDDSVNDHQYPSASALRKAIVDSTIMEEIRTISQSQEKGIIYQDYLEAVRQQHYVLPNDFSLPVHYKLLTTPSNSLVQYQDFPETLANRIAKNLNAFSTLDAFCDLLKTKELTQTRIQRALLHMLLDIRTVSKTVYYARILGFRKKSSPLLHQIKQHASIPLLTKLADAEQNITSYFSESPAKDEHSPTNSFDPSKRTKASQIAYRQLTETIQASNIYESVYASKTNQKFINEYQKQILIL